MYLDLHIKIWKYIKRNEKENSHLYTGKEGIKSLKEFQVKYYLFQIKW